MATALTDAAAARSFRGYGILLYATVRRCLLRRGGKCLVVLRKSLVICPFPCRISSRGSKEHWPTSFLAASSRTQKNSRRSPRAWLQPMYVMVGNRRGVVWCLRDTDWCGSSCLPLTSATWRTRRNGTTSRRLCLKVRREVSSSLSSTRLLAPHGKISMPRSPRCNGQRSKPPRQRRIM